jgi:hypothetical protein
VKHSCLTTLVVTLVAMVLFVRYLLLTSAYRRTTCSMVWHHVPMETPGKP